MTRIDSYFKFEKLFSFKLSCRPLTRPGPRVIVLKFKSKSKFSAATRASKKSSSISIFKTIMLFQQNLLQMFGLRMNI